MDVLKLKPDTVKEEITRFRRYSTFCFTTMVASGGYTFSLLKGNLLPKVVDKGFICSLLFFIVSAIAFIYFLLKERKLIEDLEIVLNKKEEKK